MIGTHVVRVDVQSGKTSDVELLLLQSVLVRIPVKLEATVSCSYIDMPTITHAMSCTISFSIPRTMEHKNRPKRMLAKVVKLDRDVALGSPV